MNAAVQDKLAEHFQDLASITERQATALDRRDMCERAVVMQGGTAFAHLVRIFEREAAAQSNGR